MAEKTVKVDEAVHNELDRRKRKYGVETYNDVLRLSLGIDPGTDIDKLSSFLGSELQEAVEVIIKEIDQVGDLARGYEQEAGRHILTFHIPDSDRKIARIAFRDGAFHVDYTDIEGRTIQCGFAYKGSDGTVRYAKSGDVREDISIDDVRDEVHEKVSKSYRRWSLE